jgi:hypothetical protein
MTHIENVSQILQYGITHITSAYANRNYIPIGDVSLIDNRNSFIMPNRKLLGQYIPFYFWARMPMLYVIQRGFNGVPVTEPGNIVYCVTNVRQVIDHRLPYTFTNGHAVDCFTEFFGEQDIERINELLDFASIKAKYWIDENDLRFLFLDHDTIFRRESPG